jgi:hypothetical protein
MFRVPGDATKSWCKTCHDRPPDAVLISVKKCLCDKRQPIYGLADDTSPTWCYECPEKPEEAVVITSPVCRGYGDAPCPVRTYLYGGNKYCFCCDPDDARRVTRKKYEEAFFAYVKDEVDIYKREFRVPFDPSETTKTCAYIDGIVFGDNITVCIEIDENGHSNYGCDEVRMHLATAELLKLRPGHAIAWVRVNPTIPSVRNQWSAKAKKLRSCRFKEAVAVINKAISSGDSKVTYIGFDF